MSGAIQWFARNGVAANLLVIFIILAGLMSARSIKREVFPETESGMVSVQVDYLGAAPEEVEEGVCIRVEEAIQSLEGIRACCCLAGRLGSGFGLSRRARVFGCWPKSKFGGKQNICEKLILWIRWVRSSLGCAPYESQTPPSDCRRPASCQCRLEGNLRLFLPCRSSAPRIQCGPPSD